MQPEPLTPEEQQEFNALHQRILQHTPKPEIPREIKPKGSQRNIDFDAPPVAAPPVLPPPAAFPVQAVVMGLGVAIGVGLLFYFWPKAQVVVQDVSAIEAAYRERLLAQARGGS